MSNYIETAEKTSLPLLPLRGAIAFPNVQLTLEILRPSSLRAFGEAASKKALMFLVSQSDPSVEEPTAEDFYKMGTICQIRHVTKNPDGHLSVTFEGICRASTTSITFSKGFFHAEVVKRGVHLGTVSSAKAEELTEELFDLLESMKGAHPIINDELILAARALKSPSVLADFVASGALLHYQNKQAILEKLNP
ncbi:MAG: LON peptidase substrate-binding domain-containing protein, partial [Clostridia bacterium]|nr:LON peptidase substrate-binding domain-containing protein [Clostridia bacterium]